MNKIGICGYFNHDGRATDGQSIKTRNISQEIKKQENYDVTEVDTKDWKKRNILFLFECVKIIYSSTDVLILPAINGVKILMPFFVVLGFLFNTKLHYIVIGGWLPALLKGSNLLRLFIKRVDYIYVETNTMKEKMENLELTDNVLLMKNFKNLKSVSLENIRISDSHIKMCTVSRINPKKGIGTAIATIAKINKRYNKQVILDIYGPIDEGYRQEFNKILKENSDFANYKGVIPYNDTVNVIKNYYVLLFPTKYFTEGIPGTIIDSYFSGVPVVASRWESWDDVIKFGKTGMTYEFNNENEFQKLLLELINNKELVRKMKKNCIEESENYTAEQAMGVLIKNLRK